MFPPASEIFFNGSSNRGSFKVYHTTIFIIILIISLTPKVDAQNTANEQFLRYDSITVHALMDSLTAIFGFTFAYDAGIVESNSVVNVNVPITNTDLWINNFFSKPGISVHFINQQVIISRREGVASPGNQLRLQGKVLEQGSFQPLGMVNIGVSGSPVGTITNDKGEFNLIIHQNLAGKNLVFSIIGYQGKMVKIPDKDTTIVVKLMPSSMHLPEVVVPYRSPSEIISQMVKNLATNYAGVPSLLTAFFRETIQQDNLYVDVSEAIIEILKPSYQIPGEREQVRFIRGRKGRELSEMNLVEFKLVGGPYNFSRLDIARDSDFFPEHGVEPLYAYTFEGLGYEHYRLVYKVGFKPITDTAGLMYQGELRVDMESYALVSATFQLTPQSLRRSRNYLVKRDSRRFRARPFLARYTLNYRPWNDIWVLAGVKGELNFQLIDRQNRQRTIFNTVSELLVSDASLLDQKARVRWDNTVSPNYILSDHLRDFDDGFWHDFNTIKPGENLKRTFGGERNKKAVTD